MTKTHVPAEITDRQWQQLLYFYARRGKNRTISAFASNFGVSRPGAYKAIDALEAKGLVLRGDDGIACIPVIS
jgi:DNA-binding MarR family transcriptional regulator